MEKTRRSRGRRRPRRRRDPARSLTSLGEAVELLEETLELAPADETEIVWWEVRRSRVSHQLEEADTFRRVERSAMIRVREGGRTGNYRIDSPTPGTLRLGVRQAMAHARAAEPRRRPPLPGPEEAGEGEAPPFDPRLASLSSDEAHRLLEKTMGEDEAAILEWSEGRVVVANSHELVRRAKVTAVTVQVRSGNGALAGFSAQSARLLHDLDLERAVRRARRRRALGDAIDDLPDPATPRPLVLSPDSTVQLLNQLDIHAFGARAYREGTSFLREHLGVQVFDRDFGLRDDGTDPSGLPFPFDFEGRSKRPIVLVERGVPRSPCLDGDSAADLGMEPTGHCVGGHEALASNLFMVPGNVDEEGLLAEVGDGLWIGRLERVEVYDPSRMLFRVRCRGVRRIGGGQIREALPQLIWEDSLLRVFSAFLAIGRNAVVRASGDGVLGATCAPAVAISEAQRLELDR